MNNCLLSTILHDSLLSWCILQACPLKMTLLGISCLLIGILIRFYNRVHGDDLTFWLYRCPSNQQDEAWLTSAPRIRVSGGSWDASSACSQTATNVTLFSLLSLKFCFWRLLRWSHSCSYSSLQTCCWWICTKMVPFRLDLLYFVSDLCLWLIDTCCANGCSTCCCLQYQYSLDCWYQEIQVWNNTTQTRRIWEGLADLFTKISWRNGLNI